MKMEKQCRTCMSKEITLHNIFEIKLENKPLEDILTAVTGIKIDKNDTLPKMVCQECKDKAQSAYVFKKISKHADAKLRKLAEEIALLPKEVKIEQEPDYDYDMGLDCDELPSAEPYHDNELENPVLNSLKVECEPPTSLCPICCMSFSSSASLTKHLFKAHKDLTGPRKRGRPKTLHRNILDKLADNGLYIKKLDLTGSHDCVCAFCSDPFHQKEDLVDHYYNDHTDTKVYSCLVCKRNYLQLSSFDEHTCERLAEQTDAVGTEMEGALSSSVISETNLHSILDPEYYSENIDDPQVCSFCNEIILTKSCMMNHIDTFHPEESQRCNFCLKVFASVKSAKRHKLSCKSIERKFKCRVCGLRYAYEISLNKHILRYHQGESVSIRFIDRKLGEEKPYHCQTCPKKFSREELLQKHTQTHLAKEKKYECDTCHKLFNRKDNLKSHIRIHQPRAQLKPKSLCTFCGRGFSNTSNMIVHLRRHTGEKPYKCDFCGKGFPRSSDLACHRRSHTGEKVCHCSICGKSFSRTSRLSRHMRVHTGQKPYKCTYCDKAFSQSNDLTVHVRRHTGDKPYICEVCGDRFIQGTALQNHRRAHGHYPPAPPPKPDPSHLKLYAEAGM